MSRKNFEGIKRNIPLLYIFSFLIKRPMIPIITLYYLFFNLTYTEIGLIGGITALVTLVLEIPSGIVTDYIGKRTALTFAAIMGFVSQLLFYLGNSFETFLLAAAVFGLSISFVSGTRQSLLYETVKKLGKEKQYKKYSGKMVFYGFIFNAIVLLPVPLIYELNKKAVFIIGMIFFIIGTIVALLLKEVESKNTNNLFLHIKNSFRETIYNKRLRFGILYNIAGAGLLFAIVDYFQPIMKESGIPIIYFGVMYFFMRVAMGYGSKITHTLEKYLSNRNIALIVLGLYGLVLLGMSIFNFFATIILVVLIRFLEGVHRIAVTDEIQQSITENNRTTISSIGNMYRNGYHMLIAPAMGILIDSYSLGVMLTSFAVLYLVITLLFILIKPNPKPKPI